MAALRLPEADGSAAEGRPVRHGRVHRITKKLPRMALRTLEGHAGNCARTHLILLLQRQNFVVRLDAIASFV
jgi:hypothetical protein